VRLTLKAINEEFAKRGSGARLEKGDGYFYFSGGEAADWLDRTMNAHSLSSLSLDLWMAEFDRLKKLNKEILRPPAPKKINRGRPSGEAAAGQMLDRFPKLFVTESSIGMAQVLAWGDPIPDDLLKLLDLRKPSFLGSRPDRVFADTNLENTSSAGHQHKLADFCRERRQEFLSHPRGAQQPAALRAVLDFNSRRLLRHCCAV
jgi:hypothetical protein